MSVTFSTAHEIVGWRIDCAFQPTVYGTYKEALVALEAHGREVCAPALEWLLANDRYDPAVMSAAEAELGLPPDYCEMGAMCSPVQHERSMDINMSNTNARGMFERLGLVSSPSEPETFDEDFGFDDSVPWSGHIDADDLLGRVLIAQGISPSDAGMPSTTSEGLGGATIVDCGRSVGYFDDRLVILAELAQRAKEDGVEVHWS